MASPAAPVVASKEQDKHREKRKRLFKKKREVLLKQKEERAKRYAKRAPGRKWHRLLPSQKTLIRKNRRLEAKKLRKEQKDKPTKPKIVPVKKGGEKKEGEKKEEKKKKIVYTRNKPRGRYGKLRQPTKLRKSLTPGTVVILLRGVYAGRRAIFVKQLRRSGELLIVGPYKVNGVPFHHIPQHSVIATSTKIDISSIDVSKLDNILFSAGVTRYIKKKRTEPSFFAKGKEAKIQAKHKDENKIAQTVEKAIIGEIRKVPFLKSYLQRNFFLSDNDRPHLMKF
jgi:large subunit ribosomal protein L6e